MHPLHKLGNANTVTNSHEYYKTLLNKNGTANGAASNVLCPCKTKCINMKYRTGTLYNQKHAVWFKHWTSLNCPLCPQLDGALLILPRCQRTQIRNMISERLNLACSMIFKAISETGSLGSCFVCMDIGSSERLAMQNLQFPNTTETRIISGSFHPASQTKIGLYLQLSGCCTGCSHPRKNKNATD